MLERPAVVEQVRERQAREHADRARRAEEGGLGLRGDAIQLGGVRHRGDQRRFDQRVAEGQRAAAAGLGEIIVDAQLVEQVDAGRELAVEEVGLEEAQVDQLSQAADLRLQRQALPVAEQVRLLHLRGGDEALDTGEARADLEGTGGALGDLDVDVHLVGGRALLLRDVHALEIAERGDALARLVEQRLAVLVALGDLHLAADDLVAGLGVAADLDAFEMDERPAHDGHDDVDLVRLLVQAGLRVRFHARVAVVAVHRADRLQVVQ